MPRPKKGDAPPPPAEAPRAMRALRQWAAQALLPLAAAALLLGGIVFLGGLARGPRTLPFADVDCAPPPGLGRAEFLAEVQYLAGLPDDLDLLDPGLAERLAAAFAAHPWVAAVRAVEKVPPAGVRAELVYRTPVLAVRLGKSGLRAVDGGGALLPVAAGTAGLPTLTGAAWGDARVEAAARTAAYLRPHLERLKLQGCEVQVGVDGVALTTADARLVWGQAPGQEKAGEAAAAEKLRRLLDGPPRAGQEVDLRPADREVRRALP